MATCRIVFVDEDKVKLFLDEVSACHLDGNRVSQAIDASAATTTDAIVFFNDLRFYFNCKYEEKDQIGKRYRRMDAIGCPYCITVDQQTLEDNTVTLRDRDTMEQTRVAISDLQHIVDEKVTITSLLKKLA